MSLKKSTMAEAKRESVFSEKYSKIYFKLIRMNT